MSPLTEWILITFAGWTMLFVILYGGQAAHIWLKRQERILKVQNASQLAATAKVVSLEAVQKEIRKARAEGIREAIEFIANYSTVESRVLRDLEKHANKVAHTK